MRAFALWRRRFYDGMMPSLPSRLTNPKTRQRVIALLMIASLFVSMGVAWAISGRRSVEVGDLSFSVPARWDRLEAIQNRTVFAQQANYQPNDSTDQWISVAQFHDPGPADFTQAYRLAVKAIQSTHLLRLKSPRHAMPVTVGPLQGTRFAIWGTDPNDPQSQKLILLAILSDGQRYWMVCQMQEILMDAYGRSPAGSTVHTQAFDRVLASLTLTTVASSPSSPGQPPPTSMPWSSPGEAASEEPDGKPPI